MTTDKTLSVGGAYRPRDGWSEGRDDEHANQPDTLPYSIGSGSLIRAAGSNYSVDLLAVTEPIVAAVQYFPRGDGV